MQSTFRLPYIQHVLPLSVIGHCCPPSVYNVNENVSVFERTHLFSTKLYYEHVIPIAMCVVFLSQSYNVHTISCISIHQLESFIYMFLYNCSVIKATVFIFIIMIKVTHIY